jgi:luciferase family oxidoreductase group 1
MGLLDFGERRPGQNARDRIHETLCLAAEAEKLGFSRYWLGEHQDLACSWAAPGAILALLASSTKRIRVGAGAILLRFHNPLEVASDFSLLEQLFPGRIDLGVARGFPGRNSAALTDGTFGRKGSDDYRQRLSDLIAHLEDRLGKTHRFRGSKALPHPPRTPEVWVLGSTRYSMMLAASRGTAFGYSVIHESRIEAGILGHYRARVRSSGKTPRARCLLAVAGVCAESRGKAEKILGEHRNKFIIPRLVGSQKECIAILTELQKQFEPDEFLFLDISKSPEDRNRSCRLLSGVLGAF